MTNIGPCNNESLQTCLGDLSLDTLTPILSFLNTIKDRANLSAIDRRTRSYYLEYLRHDRTDANREKLYAHLRRYHDCSKETQDELSLLWGVKGAFSFLHNLNPKLRLLLIELDFHAHELKIINPIDMKFLQLALKTEKYAPYAASVIYSILKAHGQIACRIYIESIVEKVNADDIETQHMAVKTIELLLPNMETPQHWEIANKIANKARNKLLKMWAYNSSIMCIAKMSKYLTSKQCKEMMMLFLEINSDYSFYGPTVKLYRPIALFAPFLEGEARKEIVSNYFKIFNSRHPAGAIEATCVLTHFAQHLSVNEREIVIQRLANNLIDKNYHVRKTSIEALAVLAKDLTQLERDKLVTFLMANLKDYEHNILLEVFQVLWALKDNLKPDAHARLINSMLEASSLFIDMQGQSKVVSLVAFCMAQIPADQLGKLFLDLFDRCTKNYMFVDICLKYAQFCDTKEIRKLLSFLNEGLSYQATLESHCVILGCLSRHLSFPARKKTSKSAH